MEHDSHAQLIKKGLEAAGHDVAIVDCFSKAKTLLESRCGTANGQQVCDLIISEVHLGNGGSVFDFLKWVKDDPRLNAIPFVLLSLEPSDLAKYLSDGLRVAARFLGAATYISMDTFDAVLLNEELSIFLPQNAAEVLRLVTKEIGE
jgi:hypothetical protein